MPKIRQTRQNGRSINREISPQTALIIRKLRSRETGERIIKSLWRSKWTSHALGMKSGNMREVDQEFRICFVFRNRKLFFVLYWLDETYLPPPFQFQITESSQLMHPCKVKFSWTKCCQPLCFCKKFVTDHSKFAVLPTNRCASNQPICVLGNERLKTTDFHCFPVHMICQF